MDALNIPELGRFLWTDSSTTRNWLRAVAANYTPFVSHRVGEVQSLTDASEWRFVPGKMNIADAATRSLLIDDEPIPPEWLEGPAFLRQNMEQWPKDLPWMAVSEERRAVRAQHATAKRERRDWSKVTINSSNLSACLKLEAEFKIMIKHCQEEEFGEDIKRLSKNQPLQRTSRLSQLSPFLDRDGIIRLGGRTRRAKLPYDVLHPPILPGTPTSREDSDSTPCESTSCRDRFLAFQGTPTLLDVARERTGETDPIWMPDLHSNPSKTRYTEDG
jgi:hypothetical protein